MDKMDVISGYSPPLEPQQFYFFHVPTVWGFIVSILKKKPTPSPTGGTYVIICNQVPPEGLVAYFIRKWISRSGDHKSHRGDLGASSSPSGGTRRRFSFEAIKSLRKKVEMRCELN